MASSRFAFTPASHLDLPALLRANLRRALWASLGAATLVHIALVGMNPFEGVAERTPRPITTRFVRREPRLTKPLELRKVPRPRRVLIRREVRLAAARMDQVQSTAAFSTAGLLSRTSAVAAAVGPAVGRLPALYEPLAAAEVAGARAADDKIDLGLEMLDIQDMDTGRFRAMVVQGADDRQAVKGFVHFARTYAASSLGQQAYSGPRYAWAIDVLIEKLNEWTGVRADYVGHVTYDDERLMEIPIIFPDGAPNEAEMESLARYLVGGGFVYNNGGETLTQLGPVPEMLTRYAGLVEGKDFWYQRLPEDHPIYSAYFDIGGGPPRGASGHELPVYVLESRAQLYGLFIGGRLAGVSSTVGNSWLAFDQGLDTTRQLQMAVNVVVYALTQEGSITQRMMGVVR